MIFKGSSNNSAIGFFKKTAADVITGNAISPANPLKFFSMPNGDLKSVMFKNTMGKVVILCAINRKDIQERLPASVGAVITPTTVTLSNFTPVVTTPKVNQYSYNNAQDWLRTGVDFKLQGTVSNDKNVFIVSTVVTTGASSVITLDTVNGASGVAETILPTAPVTIIPFECVPLFEIMDGDSISIDLKSNVIEGNNLVDFYVYCLGGAPTTSTINGIRAYTFS